MKIGILGSGNVGQQMAKGLLKEGHEVWIATRDPAGEKGTQLANDLSGATVTDFATAAKEAELAIFCVKWEGAEEIIKLAGAESLAGKVVMETSNIITQENGAMVYGGTGKSAAEQVQAWLPDSKVVKAFNTVGAAMMYLPQLDSKPTMFIAGDDADAKLQVADIVTSFGWEPLDTGNLIMSRHLEPMALVWINNTVATGDPHHAFKML